MAFTIRSTTSRAVATGAGMILVGILGWIDYVTGPEIGLSLLYLLPVAAAGWWVGPPSATAVAVAASAAWLAAEFSWRKTAHLGVSLWNDFSVLAIFLTIGLILARARTDRDRLASMNLRLNDLLDRETSLARTDALTGLPNLRWFKESLRSETARSRRDGHPLCLAYIDIDNFKAVNDLHGHPVGDDLLRRIAVIIRVAVRATDTTARIGGDEFGILLWDLRREAVESVARRLIAQIGELGRDYAGAAVGASIGVAYFRNPPEDTDEIVRRADLAMYEAKAAGKGRLVVWEQPEGDSGGPVHGRSLRTASGS